MARWNDRRAAPGRAARGPDAPERGPRRGFAIIAVLLVLVALLLLCVPFLATVRNADRASGNLADQAQAAVALDAAARHARAVLVATHPSVDADPYRDAEDELFVDDLFALRADGSAFLDARDTRSAMWDVDVEDLAGRIDLGSASPHVIANLCGWSAAVTRAITNKDEEIPASPLGGFAPQGFLFARGEFIHYAKLEEGAFRELQRGLGSELDESGNATPCGPRPPLPHPRASVVLDQRALAIPMWRITGGRLRAFDAPEQVREAGALALAGELGEFALRELDRFATVYGGVHAGREWQRGTRLRNEAGLKGGEDCVLDLEETRWFNAGTTVLISDGVSAEFAMVQDLQRGGRLQLMKPVANSYAPWVTEVRPLARRPVNANTAPVEVLRALYENVVLVGSQERVTPEQARQLAEITAASRPFDGFEDFLERVLLPAAGLEPLPEDAPVVPEAFAAAPRGEPPVAILTIKQVVALYRNAQNANDAQLGFATMPLCFTSRECFALELRTAVNAPSGAQRLGRVREQVELAVPQRELLAVWARQEDFDEAFRLDGEAPRWMSAPNATVRYDPRGLPPPLSIAHLGKYALEPDDKGVLPTVPVVFASRGETAWMQLHPSRVDEVGQRAGHVLHFTNETRDPEGRYLPDEPVRMKVDDPIALLADPAGLARPFGFEMWIKPQDLNDGDVLFDLAGTASESDRVSLLIEGQDLVLRVLDGAGDHPESAFLERAEVRFALNEGPGLPAEIWSHLEIQVRGNRPDQMSLFVDGMWRARTPGLTRLGVDIGEDSASIPVESTEGFPDPCVLAIGEELVEARVQGKNSFRAEREVAGSLAGFGGRMARERMELQAQGTTVVQTNMALNGKDVLHAAGTPVQLYGYSLELEPLSNVSNAGSPLPADIGPFAGARVIEGLGGGITGGDEIKVEYLAGGLELMTVPLGVGMEGPSGVNRLRLLPADPSVPIEKVMSAFNPNGGYAVLVQQVIALINATEDAPPKTEQGTPLGGLEVIYYTGWQDDLLLIGSRGDQVPELARIKGAPGTEPNTTIDQRKAFVFDISDSIVYAATGQPIEVDYDRQCFVIPISVPVPGGAGLTGFPTPPQNQSEFAQLTHVDQAELTEWVRYDEVSPKAGGHLVRDDPTALFRAFMAAVHSWRGIVDLPQEDDDEEEGDPPGGGSSGPGGKGPGSKSAPSAPPPGSSAATWTPPPAAQAGAGGVNPAYWDDDLGVEEDQNQPFTHAVRTAFQFRGVFATHSHAHEAGTLVLPVFRCVERTDAGRPGRLDKAVLMSSDPTDPGWPITVQHAHRPWEYANSSWLQSAPGTAENPELNVGPGPYEVWSQDKPPVPMPPGVAPPAGQAPLTNTIFVAAQARVPVPIASGSQGVVAPPSTGPAFSAPLPEMRVTARLALFPSGERPRLVSDVAVGGAAQQYAAPGTKAQGAVPSVVVDELAFLTHGFDPQSSSAEGAVMVVEDELSVSGGVLRAYSLGVRAPGGRDHSVGLPLDLLPADGGLLRLGDEILCYESRDSASGNITIAPNGRGLLGTDPAHHERGVPIVFLPHRRASVLQKDVGAGDSFLPVAALDDFPAEGTVLIDRELVHFTHPWRGALAMPRASLAPGENDEKGAGLFRGRYGTASQGHATGAPVILFPFRYWDRWADRADGPTLTYAAFCGDQPSAFWKTVFWKEQPAAAPGAHVDLLQRVDARVPWDADPESENALDLFEEGMPKGEGNRIGVQSDRVEWRAFVRYEAGSFDYEIGAHGWKTTPRLELFGAQYVAPGLTLRRVDS